MMFADQFRMRIILFAIIVTIVLATWGQAHERYGVGELRKPIKFSRTLDTIVQASEKQPQWILPKIYLGQAYMQRARETGNVDDYRRAQSAFQAALALNPRSDSAMIGMAWVYGVNHDFDASIRWAIAAVAANPLNPDAYGLLGDAAVALEDYNAGFRHYQKMLDIRPDLASYARGAHLLFVTGDVVNAIRLMRKAIAAGAPYAENTQWCRAALSRMQKVMVDRKRMVQTGRQ